VGNSRYECTAPEKGEVFALIKSRDAAGNTVGIAAASIKRIDGSKNELPTGHSVRLLCGTTTLEVIPPSCDDVKDTTREVCLLFEADAKRAKDMGVFGHSGGELRP
jgi:hypothetical protein